METLEKFLVEIGPVWSALLATTFTWLVTALGVSFVFFRKIKEALRCRKNVPWSQLDACLSWLFVRSIIHFCAR